MNSLCVSEAKADGDSGDNIGRMVNIIIELTEPAGYSVSGHNVLSDIFWPIALDLSQ